MAKSIVAIQNPNEIEEVLRADTLLDGSEVVKKYGDKIQYGAFVTIIDLDYEGDPDGDAELFIADRGAGKLYLQSNSNLTDREVVSIDAIGPIQYESEIQPQEEFTVFGTNDDGEKFVALVSATPETVVAEGRKAGATYEGYEDQVTIVLAVKGDQRTLGEELPAAV